jgi:endonuclease YncB( thermonuclease family)
MQLESWLKRRDVQRWLGVLALILIAIFGQQQRGQGPDPRAPLPAGNTVEGHPGLVDGDSFHLGRDEVRLKGIDAPEGRQTCRRDGREWRCGEAARTELARLIGGQKVVCRVVERDQHGRLLAQCSAGGRDLNAGMVASGMALAYGGYVKEETAAKLARRGLWGSEFQRPREWRRDHGVGGHT